MYFSVSRETDIKLSEIKTLRATSNVLALYIWCSDLVSMET